MRSLPRVALGAVLGALAVVGLSGASARAQVGFVEFTLTDSTLNSSPATDFWIASAAPADVDGDGDLDLLVAGYYVVYPSPPNDGSAEDRLTLYRNDGPVADTAWAFTPIPVDATGLTFGAADLAWGDYDNDGDPDVVVGADGAMALYRNDAGTLVRTPTVLPSYAEDSDFTTMDLRSLTWADVDNDADLDLLVPSVLSEWTYQPTLVLRNDGAGTGGAWTFADAGAQLPVAANAVSAWADWEGDGDLDLLLANVSPWGDNFLDVYRNDGGSLAVADSGLARIRYGMADWGDADNDGDLDIVYAGNIDLPDGTGETVVRILFNDGAGGHMPFDVVRAFQSPSEPWLDFSAVTWADYDSDGDVDLLVSGQWLGDGEIVGRAMVYTNTGGTFAPAGDSLPAPVAGNAGGAFTWFDVDADGDLDYFVAGGYYVPGGGGLIEARTQLFRNVAPGVNAAPSAAGALQASVEGSDVTLAWDASTDDATPQAALTYDLEVVPLALPAPGGRGRPEPGNVSGNTTWRLRGLAPGGYRWTVRAVDNAFNAGPPAQGTFSVGTVAAPGPGAPHGFALSPPRPNPSGTVAEFSLTLDRPMTVRVTLHDLSGRRVAVLREGPLGAGVHALRLEATGLPTGTYFVRATAGGRTAVRSVALIR